MLNPFRVLGSSLRDLFDEFFVLIVCNLLWMIISAPLLMVAYILLGSGYSLMAMIVALVGVLPAAPATAGLTYVTVRISEGQVVRLSHFFAGMREFAGPAWALFGIWMLATILVCFNLGFYFGVANLFGGLMLGLWLYLLILCFCLLIYIFPLMQLQERPELRLVIRNTLLMALGRPIFTFVTLVLMLLIFGLSVFLVAPIVLITPALLNLWSVRATRAVIAYAEQRRAAEASAAAQAPIDEKGRRGQVRPK